MSSSDAQKSKHAVVSKSTVSTAVPASNVHLWPAPHLTRLSLVAQRNESQASQSGLEWNDIDIEPTQASITEGEQQVTAIAAEKRL